MKKTLSIILGFALFAGLVLMQAPSMSASSSKSKKKDAGAATTSTADKAASTSAPASTPSAADIASAKSKGLVWLNVSSKVYHYSSDKVYGTTKSGKFVTEAEAKAAGAKPAGGAATSAPAPAQKSVAQPAPAPAPAVTPAAKTTAAKADKTPPPPPPNAGDIATAKSRGLVWLNVNSNVYHYSGDKTYGTTKNGKFVTEAEAKAAGGKPAAGSTPPASAPAPAPAAKTVAQPAPAPAPAAVPAAKTTAEKTAKTPPPPPPNAADIAAAKSKGLVWLNLNTKVYHNPADKEYGTTKNGKFVTEAEAKATGAKLASK